jgi:hypothetical protein
LLLFEEKHTSKAHVELFNTGKPSAVPRMKACGGVEVYFHTLLNSTTDRGGAASYFGCFTSEESEIITD